MNIAFPDWNVIDLAENANVTQHNILTPRGAKVRDTRLWVAGLTQAIERNPDATVMITSHGWPRFGRDRIRDFLTKQRDAYAFLHDQTVRLMNAGLTADAIAAQLKLPDALAREWYNRPYYGSISFNARAIYQFYLGWYDANPAHLAARSPIDAGRRYVSAMGGTAKVMSLAQAAYGTGDYAWAAELLNHVVMGEGAPPDARTLLARCYDQLAWQSENALWRNMYLSAAADLRGPAATRPSASQSGLVNGLSLAQAVDLIAIRLDPAKARDLAITLKATDTNEVVSVQVENGVLIAGKPSPGRSYVTVAAPRAELLSMLLAPPKANPAGSDGPDAIRSLREMLDKPSSSFAIVLPPPSGG
jgi:alkyl sulfatase BDS1-like metallo-beta-lactamase superfamily hydrolase